MRAKMNDKCIGGITKPLQEKPGKSKATILICEMSLIKIYSTKTFTIQEKRPRVKRFKGRKKSRIIGLIKRLILVNAAAAKTKVRIPPL